MIRAATRTDSGYRFEHPTMAIVLSDMRIPGTDPGPGDAIPTSQHASRLKQHHRLPFEVSTDDFDGTLHRVFGPRPSSAYLVDPSGHIVFRAHWSNLTPAVEEAVAAAASGLRPPAPRSAKPCEQWRG